MEIINSLPTLYNFVSDYIDRNPAKPLFIWFRGAPGVSNQSLDTFNQNFVNNNIKYKKINTNGVVEQTEATAIFYHRYLLQVEDSFLREAIKTKQLCGKPVVVLANSYSEVDKPDYLSEYFEEISLVLA